MDNSISEVETQPENEDIAPITRTSDAPAIMKARDLTAERNLIKMHALTGESHEIIHLERYPRFNTWHRR